MLRRACNCVQTVRREDRQRRSAPLCDVHASEMTRQRRFRRQNLTQTRNIHRNNRRGWGGPRFSQNIAPAIHQGTLPADMPDPIRKRSGYGQLWPLRPACSQNRAGSYMPDPTFRIHFSSVFPKKAWIILRKTDPNPIWMALSGFGQTHLVWKQAGV